MSGGRRLLWTLAAGLVLLGLAPLVAAFAASGVAALADCRLDAAMPHPCMIAGADRGPALHQMFLSGVLILMTAPLAACGVVLGLMLRFGILSQPRGG